MENCQTFEQEIYIIVDRRNIYYLNPPAFYFVFWPPSLVFFFFILSLIIIFIGLYDFDTTHFPCNVHTHTHTHTHTKLNVKYTLICILATYGYDSSILIHILSHIHLILSYRYLTTILTSFFRLITKTKGKMFGCKHYWFGAASHFYTLSFIYA